MRACEQIEWAEKKLIPDATSQGKLYQDDVEEAKARAVIAAAISLDSISAALEEMLITLRAQS